MIHIGKFKLKSNLILAPMAGITDLPFRMFNRAFGCELTFVEMLNVRSVGHKSKKTMQMLSTLPEDSPLGVQILGCEDKFILKAMDVIRKHKFDILDFNAACPVKKVVRRGEGSGLLKDPQKLAKLTGLIVKESDRPVTVKIRSGWDEDSINAREVALLCEDAGVDAVFIHGRTRMQGYGGTVDYAVIRDVKKAVNIPVIASGDILSPQLAKKMLDETGCDGLAVARGALGNPWIFKDITNFLKDGTIPHRQSEDVVVDTMMRHLDMCISFYGERVGVVIFRKFFAWYTRGFRKIRQLREKCSRVKTRAHMEEAIGMCIGA